MKRFKHVRTRGRLTSICEACGQTFAGLAEGSTYRWQRAHRCDTEQDRAEEKIDV